MRGKRGRAAGSRDLGSVLGALLRTGTCTLALGAMFAPGPASAAQYVKVCSLYGIGFFYLPGTDACAIANYLPWRVQSPFGTITNGQLPSYGDHAYAYGSQSVAIGNNAWAGGDPTSDSPGPGPSRYGYGDMYAGTAFFNAGTTAIGDSSQAGTGAQGQTNATAVGANALANAKSASAFGEGSNASGDYSLAYGTSSIASGSYSIASGVSANAAADHAIAIGGKAIATKTGGIALGYSASSSGEDAIAIGDGASATGSVAVGHSSSASNGGAAFGDFASAPGSRSTAIGYGASATGASALALGSGASAKGSNSVAIGAGSVANGANTFSVGSPGNLRRITNIAPGTGPNDAVNLVQYNNGLTATLNSAKDYTDRSAAQTLSQANDYTDQQLASLKPGTSNLQRSAFSGIAAVAALDDPGMPSAIGKTRVSVQGSMFENYAGVGLSFSHRLDTEVPLSVDGGFAHAANENLGRVGFSVEF